MSSLIQKHLLEKSRPAVCWTHRPESATSGLFLPSVDLETSDSSSLVQLWYTDALSANWILVLLKTTLYSLMVCLVWCGRWTQTGFKSRVLHPNTQPMRMMMSGLQQDVLDSRAQPERPKQTGCKCIDGINVGNKNQMEAVKQPSRSEEFISTVRLKFFSPLWHLCLRFSPTEWTFLVFTFVAFPHLHISVLTQGQNKELKREIYR